MSGLLTGAIFGVVVAAVLLVVRPADQRAGTRRAALGIGALVVRLRTGRGIPEAQLRRDAAQLLRQLSALLQSGRGEAQAWSDLHRHWRHREQPHPFTELCAGVATAEQAGAGTAEGLRRCRDHLQFNASPETRGLLDRLLAATALSEQTGAPLSRLVEQMAASTDEAAELFAAVQTAAAGPKLTQLILTLLPVGGVILGQLMGASPLAALAGGGIGMLCLIAGAGLLLLGRWWSSRMIASVMRYV